MRTIARGKKKAIRGMDLLWKFKLSVTIRCWYEVVFIGDV